MSVLLPAPVCLMNQMKYVSEHRATDRARPAFLWLCALTTIPSVALEVFCVTAMQYTYFRAHVLRSFSNSKFAVPCTVIPCSSHVLYPRTEVSATTAPLPPPTVRLLASPCVPSARICLYTRDSVCEQ